MTNDYVIYYYNKVTKIFYSNGGILTGYSDNPIIELFRNCNPFLKDDFEKFLFVHFREVNPSILYCLLNGRCLFVDYDNYNELEDLHLIENLTP